MGIHDNHGASSSSKPSTVGTSVASIFSVSTAVQANGDCGTEFALRSSIREACEQTRDPFVSIFSVSDGSATFSSGTMVVHRTTQVEGPMTDDLVVDSMVSITFSEKALGGRGS